MIINYHYYHTSGLGPVCLLSLGLCAGLRFSVVVLVWLLLPGLLLLPGFILLFPGLILLTPLDSGFLKLLGRLIFDFGFVAASAVGYCDATRAANKTSVKYYVS